MGKSTLVDARRDLEDAAELSVTFGFIAFAGEHGADARHDGEGAKEQALEHRGAVDAGRRDGARAGMPSPWTAMWYLVSFLAQSVGLGPVRSPPCLTLTGQLFRIRAKPSRNMTTKNACVLASITLSARVFRRRRRVEPLASATFARNAATTRTAALNGCPGLGEAAPHSTR